MTETQIVRLARVIEAITKVGNGLDPKTTDPKVYEAVRDMHFEIVGIIQKELCENMEIDTMDAFELLDAIRW